MGFLDYLALFTLMLFFLLGIEFFWEGRKIRWLQDIPPLATSLLPKVSIIIPALNEERHIETALASVLALDYQHKEILVINDRSTDATGAILARMARSYRELRVFHIEALPSGWLGKNHALHFGAQKAKGDYILFTDADVMFEASVLKRAVACMEATPLDHLAIAPQVKQKGLLLNLATLTIIGGLGVLLRPWQAKKPQSRQYVGIGAFNLIRTVAYWECGGMEKIAMRPDDDLKLGKLLKRQGFRQEFVQGTDLIAVEWYASLKEMIQGLMKNTFAVYEYNLILVGLASLALLFLDIWPFVALLFTGGLTQFLNGVIVFLLLGGLGSLAHSLKQSPLYALGLPLGCLLMVYVLWKATLTTLVNQGIDWRGTHYPLKQLKANRV